MDKCHRLWEYSEFVSEIESNLEVGMKRSEAIQAAIDSCIERGILADILRTEKSEVLHMIFLTEYDEKKHLRNVYKDGKEDGFTEGMTQGITKGEEMKIIRQVCKKLEREKTVEAIADELEEDEEIIAKICQVAGSVPDYDRERIYEILHHHDFAQAHLY